MSTQQWEIGNGRVWTFEATSIVTSGDVVKFEGNKVRSTQATTDRPVGVVLFPASVGKLAAVALDMIVYVNTTGNSAVVPSAGSYMTPATQGKATTVANPSGVGYFSVVGRVVALGTLNGRAKIKLIW